MFKEGMLQPQEVKSSAVSRITPGVSAGQAPVPGMIAKKKLTFQQGIK